ncbi:uncharacterized protein EDB91DRAFT_1120901 [Suillus paluster]|uniref:uncharacterized protein n=1 Tax=Suillus paluster TaxID=48578 RepID=UPI001B885846|nr:uncharacterized protein EDB91DRAFT_1120901 [Suillus paluster]KAG1745444.1 hypothetical protein EDB91DRAFT_1120901 [Suillus paluster]
MYGPNEQLTGSPADVYRCFMLPSPISSNRRAKSRHLRSFSSSDLKRALSLLRARSRFTHLSILILTGCFCVSFLYNLAFIFSSPPSSLVAYTPPQSILSTIARNSTLENLSHLVIVPGHAIWTGTQPDEVLNEDRWTLEEYQRGGGGFRIAAFVEHIRRGVEITLKDDTSLLIFSGGQTRLQSTTTEAESYMRLATSLGLFYPESKGTHHEPYFPRATTETHALDSYQNFLFSVARFHEMTGRYPLRVTVVGYEMKRRRFEELHRAAIRFPSHNFEYIGIEPAGEQETESARMGEVNNGYAPYNIDLYGCHDFLLAKRRGRNPFLRFHSYHASAPELRGLLEWCPDDARMVYDGPLPWDIYE